MKENKIDKILNQNSKESKLLATVKEDKKEKILENELNIKKEEISNLFNNILKD